MTERPTNRGRGAAASNRRALVAAARSVFADNGLDAPLSAVARTAGVGQGSLYRHFPDRIDLALAVFEENVADLERLAGDPTSTLDDVVGFLTDRSIDSVAFVDMIAPTNDDERLTGIAARVTAVLATTLEAARAEGRVEGEVDAHDLFLAVGMVAHHLARIPAADRRATADRAWSLLWRGLSSGSG